MAIDPRCGLRLLCAQCVGNQRAGDDAMSARNGICAGVTLAFAMLAAGLPAEPRAQQDPAPAVAIDNDDIGGVVTRRVGPEAGVWGIARTTEPGNGFAK